MAHIHQLIDKIRRRPGMYIGSNSLTGLECFLNGYICALYETDSTDEDLLPLPFGLFHEYVACKYGYYESTSGWKNMILDQTGQDERRGLDLFFEIYGEFRTTKIEHCSTAVLSSENLRFHNNNPDIYSVNQAGERKPVYSEPVKCRLLRLNIPGSYYLFFVELREKNSLDRRFFRSRQEILEYAELCFGPVEEWAETDMKSNGHLTGEFLTAAVKVYLE